MGHVTEDWAAPGPAATGRIRSRSTGSSGRAHGPAQVPGVDRCSPRRDLPGGAGPGRLSTRHRKNTLAGCSQSPAYAARVRSDRALPVYCQIVWFWLGFGEAGGSVDHGEDRHRVRAVSRVGGEGSGLIRVVVPTTPVWCRRFPAGRRCRCRRIRWPGGGDCAVRCGPPWPVGRPRRRSQL